MAQASGRQRYRWLPLLVAAAILVAGLVVQGAQNDAGPTSAASPTSSASSASSSPTHRLTETSTATSEPTEGTDPDSGLPIVRLADLPFEAARTVELIDRGGPFPEPEHDGGTFGNREELLPDRPMGYYREYTVPTPGSVGRGARRIVTGEGGQLFWTGDHYRSFARIARA